MSGPLFPANGRLPFRRGPGMPGPYNSAKKERVPFLAHALFLYYQYVVIVVPTK